MSVVSNPCHNPWFRKAIRPPRLCLFPSQIPPEEGFDFAGRYQNGFEAEIRDLAAG